jgi:hypothetical protein
MGFLLRLVLTILLLPVFLLLGGFPSFLWIGYEEQRAARLAAKWMANHPVETALIERERKRRLEIEHLERTRQLAEERAAAEAKSREIQRAIDAALAAPLSETKAKLLSEMPFPPSIADMKRLAKAE